MSDENTPVGGSTPDEPFEPSEATSDPTQVLPTTASVPAASDPSATVAQPVQPATEANPSGGVPSWAVGAIVLLVVVVMLVLFLVLRGNSSSPADSTTSTTSSVVNTTVTTSAPNTTARPSTTERPATTEPPTTGTTQAPTTEPPTTGTTEAPPTTRYGNVVAPDLPNPGGRPGR